MVLGFNAAKIAVGMGAQVTILDINAQRLAEIDNIFDGKIQTLMSNTANIKKAVEEADLVVGAVLIPGAKAPKLVTEEMVKNMKPSSVIVDIPIDQGGIFETTVRATTHEDPIYVTHDVIHYTVANMPGAVPKKHFPAQQYIMQLKLLIKVLIKQLLKTTQFLQELIHTKETLLPRLLQIV